MCVFCYTPTHQHTNTHLLLLHRVRRIQRHLDAFPALGNALCVALDGSIGDRDRLGGELQLLRGRFETVLGGLGLDLNERMSE